MLRKNESSRYPKLIVFGLFVFFFLKASHKEKDEKSDEDGEESDSNTTKTCENLVDSSLPPVDRKQQRIVELQKMKANCKSEDLEQLKTRCEVLIRNCIVGLLAQLSDEDFKNMEGMFIGNITTN